MSWARGCETVGSTHLPWRRINGHQSAVRNRAAHHYVAHANFDTYSQDESSKTFGRKDILTTHSKYIFLMTLAIRSTVTLGVGMTDIPVGWALRHDLVRQIAAPPHNCDDANSAPLQAEGW